MCNSRLHLPAQVLCVRCSKSVLIAPAWAVFEVEDDMQPQLQGWEEGGPEEGRQLLLHVHHHLIARCAGDCTRHFSL